MKICALLLLFVTALHSAAPQTPFLDCASTGVTINNVNVSGCTERVCVLQRGTNVSAHITFTPNQPFKELTNVVVGYLMGQPIQFRLPDPSVCDHGIHCPMGAGETGIELLSSYIQKDFPLVTITSRLMLVDSHNKEQGCVEVVFQLK